MDASIDEQSNIVSVNSSRWRLIPLAAHVAATGDHLFNSEVLRRDSIEMHRDRRRAFFIYKFFYRNASGNGIISMELISIQWKYLVQICTVRSG